MSEGGDRNKRTGAEGPNTFKEILKNIAGNAEPAKVNGWKRRALLLQLSPLLFFLVRVFLFFADSKCALAAFRTGKLGASSMPPHRF